ncbi:MAG: 50S ribosomal protein L25/general stress protein Ctc [Alphaproteobacteria bacterium]|nr:50S ribosomal protein L25/general stress protein Ctc [Alphaproteobacteria bacterium]
MSKVELKVLPRKDSGKGAARAIRRQGLIPAVIYGNKSPAETIALEPKEFIRQMSIKGFRTRQFELVLEGKKELALCQAVQLDKISDFPLHADFLRIDANKEIAIEIPFTFVGKELSAAIKSGGILNIVAHTAPVLCKPSDMVDAIEVDVSKLEAGDSIQSTDITLPKGIKFDGAEKFAIASITLATVDDTPAAAATETAAAAAPAATAGKDAKAAPAAAPAKDAKKK